MFCTKCNETNNIVHDYANITLTMVWLESMYLGQESNIRIILKHKQCRIAFILYNKHCIIKTECSIIFLHTFLHTSELFLNVVIQKNKGTITGTYRYFAHM